MAKFLTGEELSNLIYDIIWNAKSKLLIVSPYIKLDDYFKELFLKHKAKPELNILLIFGKNEKSVSKSLNIADFEFFKEFPNVSIVYAPNLHAKYYANEYHGVITSINLYDYSFKNNIEFGVFAEQSIFEKISKTSNVDDAAWQTCIEIAEKNEVVFIKRPIFENKKGLLSKSKNYMGSKVLFDSTDKFYKSLTIDKTNPKSVFDYPDELSSEQIDGVRPERISEEKDVMSTGKVIEGFCIRSGQKIPFNPERRFSYTAYQSWSKYENPNFEEKFCHFSGEPSFGKTSMAKPILNKNWIHAKKIIEELGLN
ncbi:hypothetical protein SAMN04488519_10656 [Algoriphagus ornithinivorans]|uniref:PLD-like domain-containing protein n=1 Tax=Algoriphagus ornithinivorans TaxID=226506 RepID=A0A1I5GT92_9BACT|nr:phospholipase D family protein [Algoriphagus ornithinivorans]SFO39232.1 hypothetical protein SAMN04488519_10656 [Algoriphagus ornithinivorans]